MRTNTATMLKSTLFALLLLPMAAMAAPYVITGSGTSFTATIDGDILGTANTTIANVIAAIKADANGSPCEIQFGNGTTELNIGAANINFNGNGVGWNATISGKIASANTSSNGAIYLSNGANLESKADITNNDGPAIRNNGTGTLIISGGTVSVAASNAVYNNSTGKIIISGTAVLISAGTGNTTGTVVVANNADTTVRLEITGGMITNTNTGNAVYNNSTGTVAISGGSISSTSGYAVRNNSTGTVAISGGNISSTTRNAVQANSGKIVISETANITSAITGNSNGAVVINVNAQLEMTGGTITNTANGNAIHSLSVEGITISGGTVSATTGNAIRNTFANKITISGTANITSANTSSSNGTIGIVDGDTVAAVRLEIIGGTITNTAASGNAVYNSSIGGSISLGGNPAIMGKIRKTETAGNLEIITNGENKFAPEQIYTLDFATYTAGTIAATGGKDYLGNFKVANSDYGLVASGNNLVIATATEICLAEGNVWEDGACRAKTEQEVCAETDGSQWIDGDCKTDAEILAEQIAACEESGKVWEDDECKTITTPTRRPQIASGNIRAYAANKSIVLENLPKDAKVEVYSLQGKRIYSANSENSQILAILIQTKGVYIAKIGTQSFRVAVF